ncbi:hypothetical protein OC846_002134 [Tilletia horrida]|uniref:Charged multivesicular body protein 7 n=1 Tax=Tilletia horrida TaxID=155126 RepID=A0AAN6GU82_9BASI|nr:hypothetical protein OC846_002134 [Tilletia horrida]KAK0570205.1 hypothetical protein OC861_000154 [Tilletia horrida]
MTDASPSSHSRLTLPSFLASHPACQPPKAVLPALYSDLNSQRSSNPHAFASSIDKWHSLISDATLLDVSFSSSASASDRLVLHADDALQAKWEIRGIGRPLGLGTVIAELATVQQRHLIRINDFLTATSPLSLPTSSTEVSSATTAQTLGRVAARMLAAPLWWSLAQLGIGGASESYDDDQYGTGSAQGEGTAFWKKHVKGDWVIWRNLDRAATAVIEAHYTSAATPIDHLYSADLFRKLLLPKAQQILSSGLESSATTQPPPITLSELDVRVLIKHLTRDRKIAAYDAAEQIIKFGQSQHSLGAVERISEADRGIVQVRDAHARLERQIGEVESRISARDSRIRAALRAQPKQMTQAKSYLSSKKALEDLLKRRLDAFQTMSAVLLKLEQASGDIEIMQAYNTSTSTLKALLSHPSLQLDKVDDTMAALSDAMADHAELDEAVRTGEQGLIAAGSGVAGGEIDEDELRRELEALEMESIKEQQERRQEQQQQVVPASLPQVPSSAVAHKTPASFEVRQQAEGAQTNAEEKAPEAAV